MGGQRERSHAVSGERLRRRLEQSRVERRITEAENRQPWPPWASSDSTQTLKQVGASSRHLVHHHDIEIRQIHSNFERARGDNRHATLPAVKEQFLCLTPLLGCHVAVVGDRRA